jgi:hypothetical protein
MLKIISNAVTAMRGLIGSRLFWSVLVISPPALAGMDYHGFHIDDHLLSDEQKARFSSLDAPSLDRQLDIVESVGLAPDILNFFRGITIFVDPALRGNPGYFSVRDGQAIISVQPIVFAENKPILLHELLHAYHYGVLSMRNQTILDAYDAAKHGNFYPAPFQNSHFLSNEKEFFAISGTIYLFGKIQQPPFDCAILANTAPDYLAFLGKTFGQHPCR